MITTTTDALADAYRHELSTATLARIAEIARAEAGDATSGPWALVAALAATALEHTA